MKSECKTLNVLVCTECSPALKSSYSHPIQNPLQKSVLVMCLIVIVNILTKKEKRYFLNSLLYVLGIEILNFIVFKMCMCLE